MGRMGHGEVEPIHLGKASNVFRWLFSLTCDLKWHLMLVRWLLLPWPVSGVQYKTVLVALSLICLVVGPSIHPILPCSPIFSHRRHFRPIPISSNTKSPLSPSCRISPLLVSFCSAIQTFRYVFFRQTFIHSEQKLLWGMIFIYSSRNKKKALTCWFFFKHRTEEGSF